jgi:LSD1 subclass zinc finger protein
MMDALDGNAIAGLLVDVLGSDLTAAVGVCATCNAQAPVAETVVYLRGPGTVVRCRTCHAVQMVFVEVRGITCVDLRGVAAVRLPA